MGSGTGDRSSPGRREPTLHVRLLGGVDLRLDDTPMPPLGSGRAESLLAYLLLHRDAPQPRQGLAFLLWPESTEPQARTNLRHVLHNLRRALPDADRFIDVRPRTLQWRADARVWLDVAAFEQAVAEGRLEEAVETYRGELLEGSYDEWLLEERERLAHLHVDVLERLARTLEEQARWREAIRYAERLIRADPLREDAYRLVIRLCDAAGDRGRALRVYHVCTATLQRELGVEPSAATREAYEALLPGPQHARAQDREVVVPARPVGRRGPASPGSAPLVGRTAERAQLAALWRAAEAGRAQLAMVTGEAGVGKSRLVEELRASCAHAGAPTAEGRAYAAEGAMAYGLVGAWLRSDAIAPRLRRLDRIHRSSLARLVPELLPDVHDLPPPEPLPESEQRQRLFDALSLAMATTGAPLLLVADDLQWCDVESLQFMHYLLRAQPEVRLLIAATARREEAHARHPLNELIAALQALGRIWEIRLERLSRNETGLLGERITGRPLGDAEVDRLYAESEGNALFVVEALRADPAAPRATGAMVSSKVQAVITARLAQLSEAAAELAGVAATIGREFTTEVLVDASGVEEHTFVRGLDELWRRGLVRAQGPNAYDFSHGKIRDVAYEALSPAQVRHHHLRVARALERSHAGGRDRVSAQIAAHYERAGASGEAAVWYEQAAEAAQRLHASADAVRFLERALELAQDLRAGTERAALELRLLTALPAPLVAVEGYLSERVAQVHERAVELAEALGVEPEAPLVRSIALACHSRGDFDGARSVGERLRALAERDGDEVLWVESAYVLGVAAFWQGRLEAARAHFAAAVQRCRPEHRGAHLLRYGQDSAVFCRLRLGYTLWLLGRADESREACEAALALADECGHPFTRVSTTAWAALLALDQHDEDRLRRHVHALTTDQDAQRARPTRLFTETLTGYVAVLDGRSDDGIRRIRHGLEEARTGEPAAPGLLAMHMRILLEACAGSSQTAAGLAAADEALRMGGGMQLWEAEVRRLRAGFLRALGATSEQVTAELEHARTVAERQGARSIEVRVRESLEHLRAGTVRGTLTERSAVHDGAHGHR